MFLTVIWNIDKQIQALILIAHSFYKWENYQTPNVRTSLVDNLYILRVTQSLIQHLLIIYLNYNKYCENSEYWRV